MRDDEPERNAGSHQLVETGWRPISEAPKDGGLVLMWPRSSEHAAASWSDDRWCLSCCGQTAYDITHFMPLPPPPDAPGSPQLDEPLRSRHEAALDIAVKALQEIAYGMLTESGNLKLTASRELEKLAKLVPEVVRPC